MHAKQLEGSLAPGVQALEGIAQLLLLHRAQLIGGADTHAVLPFEQARLEVRQLAQAGLPTGQVAMPLGIGKAALQGGRQVGQPVLQRGTAQVAVQRGIIDHTWAIIEPKLRHWNQRQVWPNPAACNRSKCACWVSSSMTFSMALRFCAISRSL